MNTFPLPNKDAAPPISFQGNPDRVRGSPLEKVSLHDLQEYGAMPQNGCF